MGAAIYIQFSIFHDLYPYSGPQLKAALEQQAICHTRNSLALSLNLCFMIFVTSRFFDGAGCSRTALKSEKPWYYRNFRDFCQ
jgi:hypothetical protein